MPEYKFHALKHMFHRMEPKTYGLMVTHYCQDNEETHV